MVYSAQAKKREFNKLDVDLRSRFDARICHPDQLNQFTSTTQVRYFLKLAEMAYHGLVTIKPIEWAIEIDSTPQSVRKITKLFIDREILTSTRNRNVYQFNFYKSMTNESGSKGYVKLYHFLLFSNSFKFLSLPGQRLVLYFLGLISKQSSSNRYPIKLKIQDWFGRGEVKRLFPFNNKEEVLKAINEASIFFDLDQSKLLKSNSFTVIDLKLAYKQVASTSGKGKWMGQFLEENQIFYYKPFHVKHLVQMLDKLEMEIGWELALNTWTKAFINANFDSSTKGAEFFGKLSAAPEDTDSFSEPVLLFRDVFLADALAEEGLTVASIYETAIENNKNQENQKAVDFWKEKVDGISRYVIEKHLSSPNLKKIPAIADKLSGAAPYVEIRQVVLHILDRIKKEEERASKADKKFPNFNWLKASLNEK